MSGPHYSFALNLALLLVDNFLNIRNNSSSVRASVFRPNLVELAAAQSYVWLMRLEACSLFAAFVYDRQEVRFGYAFKS